MNRATQDTGDAATAAPALPDADLGAWLESAVKLFRGRQLEAARAAFESLVEPATAATNGAVQAQALYWAARCARRQERPDDALRLIYAGLAAARGAQQGATECLLRAELVRVLGALGQNDDALEEADAALQRAAHLRDAVGQASAQEALASIYWLTQDWALGLKAYAHALALAEACDHLELRVLCTLGLASTTEGIGQVAAEQGDLAGAAEAGQRSLQLQRDSGVLAAQLGDDYLVMYSELNTGCSLYSLHALAEAKDVFEGCLADASRELVHGYALTMLGRIAFDEGDLPTALSHLQRALPVTERQNKPFPVLPVLENLVNVHEALGDAKSALACMRRYHALHVKNASDKARLRAQAMSVKYETERALAVADAQRQRADKLEVSNAGLAQEAAFHARAALLDGLTGVANRRSFDQSLSAQAVPGGGLAACSLALIDIDHFKRVNDTFSHPVGDEVLRRVAALLQASCRRNDLVARYGGEEFALLATPARRQEMQQMCERMRSAVASEDWQALRPGLVVTVSVGLAHHDEVNVGEADAAQALLALADSRLYAAKSAGRNRVCATPQA